MNLDRTRHTNLRTAHICVHIVVHYCRTQQHAAVLIILPLNLQTSIAAQILSTGGKQGKGDNISKVNEYNMEVPCEDISTIGLPM